MVHFLYMIVGKIYKEKLRIGAHSLRDDARPPAPLVRSFNCISDGVVVIVGCLRGNGSDSGIANIFFLSQSLCVAVRVAVVAYLVMTPSPMTICIDNHSLRPGTIYLHLHSRLLVHSSDRYYSTTKPQNRSQSRSRQLH